MNHLHDPEHWKKVERGVVERYAGGGFVSPSTLEVALARVELLRRDREYAEQQEQSRRDFETALADKQVRAATDVAKATRWAMWAAVASAFGVLITAIVGGFQFWDTHAQLAFATKPSVDFVVEDDPDRPVVGIGVTNAGPAPARIKSVTFYVDRKPVSGPGEAGTTYGKLPAAELDYLELEQGDTLAVGEKVWLIRYRKPRGGKANPANMSAFADFIDQRLAIEIEVCSVSREEVCWRSRCSTKGQCR